MRTAEPKPEQPLRRPRSRSAEGRWLLLFVLSGAACVLLAPAYLVFHGVVETASVAVAAIIFSIGWHSRRFVRSNLILVLSVGYLSVAAIDLMHMLSFKGMGVFRDATDADPGTQFWIAARLVEAVTFLLGALLLPRRRLRRPGALLLGFVLLGIALIASVLPYRVFPTCYLEGSGLTTFKVASEFAISFLFGLAAWLLWRARALLDRAVLYALLGALAAKILSEMAFTVYVDVYGAANVAGHILKLYSVFFIYVALVQSSLATPYETLFRGLARSEERLKAELQERVRTQQLLQAAKDSAEAANRSKSDFLANMSHEIRTPMNAIIGMTDLVLDSSLQPDQREFLSMARSSAHSLLAIINDVLDLSKIEAGQFAIDDYEFDLRAAAEHACEAVAISAQSKDLELTCRVDPCLPQHFAGDEGRLKQVLLNLVGNAVKFTERGEVDLQVDRAAQAGRDDDRVMVRFRVRDTGVGIPADKLDKLFLPFTQLDGSVTRRHGGTGLGLAISRGFVALMNGTIHVQSEPGRGSCFTVEIPLRVPSQTVPAIDLQARDALQGKHALVVDDSEVNRGAVQELLSCWGMQVRGACGGDEALAALEEAAAGGEPYAFVLLDSSLPGRSGLAVAAGLRATRRYEGPLVFMATASDLSEATARCRELAPALVLMKPIRMAPLRSALLHDCGPRPAGAAPQTSPAAQALSLPPAVRVLLAEDNLVNQRLVEALMRRVGWSVATVTTGMDAVQRIQAEPVDVVLMDVQMPLMDGFEATRQIRALDGRAAKVPIIGLTAHALTEDRERCLKAGMDDYLAKPIDARQLYATIQRHLRSRAEPGDASDA